LGGTPDSYTADWIYPSSVSPDGRWIVDVHVDRAESDVMLVEKFR